MSNWLTRKMLGLVPFSQSRGKNSNGIPMVERNPNTDTIKKLKESLVALTKMKVMNAVADGVAENDSCNFTLVDDAEQVIYRVVLFFNAKSRITDIALEYREGSDPRRVRSLLEKFCKRVEQRKVKGEYMGKVSIPHSNLGGL